MMNFRYIGEEYHRASGEVALGHVTNYAQNTDGMVWDMHMLEQHMGEQAGAAMGPSSALEREA